MAAYVPIDVDAYRKALLQEREKHVKHLLSGGCGSLEDYKKTAAKVQTLDFALNTFKEILNKDEDPDA